MMLNVAEELDLWYPVLEPVLKSAEGKALGERLARDEKVLQPSLPNIFRALKITQPSMVKVVILGQDPYPGGHADGLAFSSGIPDMPYSLEMLFRNMATVGITRTRVSLEDWARQGVLLLNTAFTTIRGIPDAHSNIGWRPVIDTLLDYLITLQQPIFFICWGTPAKFKLRERHSDLEMRTHPWMVVQGNHPASVRHGYLFYGGQHLIKANNFLTGHGLTPIKWSD